MRAAAIVCVLALVAAWVTYVHVWQYGAIRPLEYRLGKMRDYTPRRPGIHVSTQGNLERVLITSGPRSSSGYSIAIRKALVERGRISITVEEIDKPGRAAITYPYRLLVFPKLGKPVHVHWEGRS